MTKKTADGLRFLSKSLIFAATLLADAAELLDPQRQLLWEQYQNAINLQAMPFGSKREDWS